MSERYWRYDGNRLNLRDKAMRRTFDMDLPVNEMIDRYLDSHAQIGALLDEIQNHGLFHPTSKQRVLEMEESILLHLSHEEQHLYPLFDHLALSETESSILLETTLRAMEDVSMKIVHFLVLYLADGSPALVENVFQEMCVALKERIDYEEKVLFNLIQVQVRRPS